MNLNAKCWLQRFCAFVLENQPREQQKNDLYCSDVSKQDYWFRRWREGGCACLVSDLDLNSSSLLTPPTPVFQKKTVESLEMLLFWLLQCAFIVAASSQVHNGGTQPVNMKTHSWDWERLGSPAILFRSCQFLVGLRFKHTKNYTPTAVLQKYRPTRRRHSLKKPTHTFSSTHKLTNGVHLMDVNLPIHQKIFVWTI